MLDVREWVVSAILLVIFACVLYVMIQSLSQTQPGFGQYGQYLFWSIHSWCCNIPQIWSKPATKLVPISNEKPSCKIGMGR
jgi:hypothetical protein